MRRLVTGILVRLVRSPATLWFLRLRYRLDRKPVVPDSVTVVIVNWESLEFLRTSLEAIRRFSDPTVRVLVVDNASKDGSRAYLKSNAVDSIRLPVNIGHGAAIDIGCLVARSEYLVALDVDAFPISPGWLDAVIGPLNEGYTVAGAHIHRAYAHPCFLGIRQERFVNRRHSFRPHLPPLTDYLAEKPSIGSKWWDAGEAISLKEGHASVKYLPLTEVRGPGLLGSVFADTVYHNFYSTLSLRNHLEGPGPDDVRAAWDEAVGRFLATADDRTD